MLRIPRRGSFRFLWAGFLIAARSLHAAPQEKISLPLIFEQNQGQADVRYRYLATTDSYNLLLARDEAVLVFKKGELHMRLVGSNPDAAIEPLEAQAGRTHYFLGNDPKQWVRNVSTYQSIRLRDVYPGIDVIYYGRGRECENDFRLAPGADPNRIRVSFTGATRIEIDAQGDLVVTMPAGSVRWHKPFLYQEAGAARKEIQGRYRMRNDNEVAFQVDEYDATKPLVLDPTFSYSSYFGTMDNEGATKVTVDPAGNAYLVGCARSRSFQNTSGTFQTPAPATHNDILIAKFSPTGSLLFQTHIGGKKENIGLGIAADGTGVYVTGVTSSSDFPVQGGFQKTLNGKSDAFVLKLDLNGDALIYSTYLGGGSLDAAAAIAVDSAGNAYVTGTTMSADFPLKGAYQSTFRGGPPLGLANLFLGDAFVAKIDRTGSTLVYSTYFGGTGNDVGLGIAVDAAGAAYVTGMTTSLDLPTTRGAFRTAYGGAGGEMNIVTGDAFVLKLDASGQPVYSTYLGGNADDCGFSVAVDGRGNAYVVGTTFSTNFPTRQPLQAAYAGTGQQDYFKWSGGDAFVTALNAAGSDLVYSTYLGGSLDDRAMSIVLDAAGNAWVAGHTLSTNFPVTKDAAQATNHGDKGTQSMILPIGFVQFPFGLGDAFVAQLDPGGKLLYSSFLGGTDDDAALGLTLDAQGHLYVVGNTMSIDFPVTNNALQPRFGGYSNLTSIWFGDAFLTIYQVSPGAPVSAASLRLSAAASAASVPVGSPVTYTFTIQNPGPAAVANLKVSGSFSGGAVQLTGVTISAGSCGSLAAAAPQLTCTAATLSGSASLTITIQGAAQQVGSAQAIVNVTFDNGTAQSAQAAIVVTPPAGGLQFALPSTKSASSGTPAAIALAGANVALATANIEVYQNNPTAQAPVNLTARPPLALPPGSAPAALLAADLNGDQAADLILLDNTTGAVTTFLAGTAGFSIAQSFGANPNARAMTLLNLNNDGIPDLAVIGDNGVALFTGNGDGTFTPFNTFDVAGRQGSLLALTAGAFTGAGSDDLVVTDSGGDVWLLPADGSGGFGTPAPVQTGAVVGALTAGDFNGDGALDLALARNDAAAVSILAGDGAGGFGAPVNFNTGAGPGTLLTVDFNGDGALDLAVVVSAQNAICLLPGDGTGNFLSPLLYAVGSQPVALAAGDLNGDGKPDIAVANSQSQDFSILINQN